RLSIFNLGLFFGGVVGFGTGIVVGFPAVVIVLAVPGLVLAALVARLPVPPRGPALPAATLRRASWRELGRGLAGFAAEARALLAIRTLRWLMASTTAMAFAAGGYNAWLKEFLTRDKGMSDAAAGELLGLALVGGLAGILVGGRVADRLRAR